MVDYLPLLNIIAETIKRHVPKEYNRQPYNEVEFWLTFVINIWPPQLLAAFCLKLLLLQNPKFQVDRDVVTEFTSSWKDPQKLQLSMAYLVITVGLYHNAEELQIGSDIVPSLLWPKLLSGLHNHAGIKYPLFRQALGIISVFGGDKRAKVGTKLTQWDSWTVILLMYPCIQQDERFSDVTLYLQRIHANYLDFIGVPSEESSDGLTD
jgi:hypothetical protein